MPPPPSTVGDMKPTRALGAWALVCAIIAPVWLFGGLYAVLFATRDESSMLVRVLGQVAAFGWFVVPLAVLSALGLGIAAIATRRGRGLGVAALVALLLTAVLVVVFTIASFGGIPI